MIILAVMAYDRAMGFWHHERGQLWNQLWHSVSGDVADKVNKKGNPPGGSPSAAGAPGTTTNTTATPGPADLTPFLPSVTFDPPRLGRSR